MKKILYLVTGAVGHLGSVIVENLLALGKFVVGFVLPSDKIPLPKNERFEVCYGNILDEESLDRFFNQGEDVEVNVIHTAGIISIDSSFNQKMYDVNVQGTKNVVMMCEKYQVNRLVHVSSVHAIPELPNGEMITEIDCFDPKKVHGPYAKTKSAASQIVLDACKRGLNASIVHPSGILGPNDTGHGNITHLIIDYCNGKLPVCVKGGYNFVDVRDVALGAISCVDNGKQGECYILSGHYYQVTELINFVREETKQKPIKIILPLWFAKFTAIFAEWYYKSRKLQPLFTRYSLYTITSNANFSNQKAKDCLAFTTRPMQETIHDLLVFLNNKGLIKVNV